MNNLKDNIKYKKHELGYKDMFEALLSNEGVSFTPLSKIDYQEQPLVTINTLWDETHFNQVNLPKVLFKLTPEEISLYSCEELIRVLDMPIKFPNTNYKIPKELFFSVLSFQKLPLMNI